MLDTSPIVRNPSTHCYLFCSLICTVFLSFLLTSFTIHTIFPICLILFRLYNDTHHPQVFLPIFHVIYTRLFITMKLKIGHVYQPTNFHLPPHPYPLPNLLKHFQALWRFVLLVRVRAESHLGWSVRSTNQTPTEHNPPNNWPAHQTAGIVLLEDLINPPLL